jgi:hypothetical protein
MIYALASRKSMFGIGDYLKTDGIAVADLVTVLSYEQVLETGSFPIGAYLFMGLDELTPTEMLLVVRARQALAEASPSTGRFNDPTRWLRRGALLKAAFRAGTNVFRATRATERDPHRRFPVFIRSEPAHTGALSPLLHSEGAIFRSLLAALVRGYRLRDLLVVEYCDTADADGVFTKYSAMILGDRIVARSHTRSRDPITKYEGRLVDPSAADANLQYVADNPHESWLREMFALGGVEYGRIDYGLLDGKPQLWEINTNPTIGANLAFEEQTSITAAAAPEGANLRAMELGNQLFYSKFRSAIESLSRETDAAVKADGGGVVPVTIAITSDERDRLKRERARRDRVVAQETVMGRMLSPLRGGYRLVRSGLRGKGPTIEGKYE